MVGSPPYPTKWCKPHDDGKGALVPVTEFDRLSSAPDGLQSYCHACKRVYNRERFKMKYRSDEEFRKRHLARTSGRNRRGLRPEQRRDVSDDPKRRYRCSICHQNKKIQRFGVYTRKNGERKVESRCRVCKRAYDRENYRIGKALERKKKEKEQ